MKWMSHFAFMIWEDMERIKPKTSLLAWNSRKNYVILLISRSAITLFKKQKKF